VTVFYISIAQFSEECDVQCSTYREHSGISWRSFSRPESPFHMFYPAVITMNGVEFTSAGQYMLYKQAGKWNIYVDGYNTDTLPSSLWHCQLGTRKSIWPVKKIEWWSAGMVISLEQGANGLHQMVKLIHCHPIIFCFIKIQNGLTFLVPPYPLEKKLLSGCLSVLCLSIL